MREIMDEGFPAEDVPDVYYTYEQIRRWAGADLRKYLPTAEVVAPFCGRAYMRAAFQFDALHRWTEPLHYQMLRMLDRRLHRMRIPIRPATVEEPECDLELAAASNLDCSQRAPALESAGPLQEAVAVPPGRLVGGSRVTRPASLPRYAQR